MSIFQCEEMIFEENKARDLIKKSTTWRWGLQEQHAYEELSNKVAKAKCSGVPKAQGVIVLVTDSKLGGGGRFF